MNEVLASAMLLAVIDELESYIDQVRIALHINNNGSKGDGQRRDA